ncbi:hypothetical protein [Pirellula sp. SH-Sr6A]|uniref:hypothetical protein n=1 Tax=Pirellula sp. SH-Sr6A TaxID=1632865 RepID=UPI0011BA666D|nr:hypothetical protein [Pirellula sp. SH-Sr6A]
MNQDALNLALDGVEMGFRVIAAKLDDAAKKFSDKEIAAKLSFNVQLRAGDSIRQARKTVRAAAGIGTAVAAAVYQAFSIGLEDFCPWTIGYVNGTNNFPWSIALNYDPLSIDDETIDSTIEFATDRDLSFADYERRYFAPISAHHQAVVMALKAFGKQETDSPPPPLDPRPGVEAAKWWAERTESPKLTNAQRHLVECVLTGYAKLNKTGGKPTRDGVSLEYIETACQYTNKAETSCKRMCDRINERVKEAFGDGECNCFFRIYMDGEWVLIGE